MTTVVALLLVGVLCAAVGAHVLVTGAVGLARRWGWSPVVLGVVVAGFGTSAPEFAVAIRAAATGVPEVALGDVLGSNVVNLGLVLGPALLVRSLLVERAVVRRDVPVAAGAPLLVLLLAADGLLSRRDALLLLVVFGIWLGQALLAAGNGRRHQQQHVPTETTLRAERAALIGLVLLSVAGMVIVAAAVEATALLGWEGYSVGALIVAVATSAPEIATVIVARVRMQDGLGLGTLLGSNIFNTLAIIGVATMIRPIVLEPAPLVVAGGAAVVLSILVLPGRSWRLPRSRGALLIAAFVVTTVLGLGATG